jgi:hypothetical protein
MRTNNPLHNPFFNRFNDPVRRRHDDGVASRTKRRTAPDAPLDFCANRTRRTSVAGVFTLFFIIVSVAVLFRSL